MRKKRWKRKHARDYWSGELCAMEIRKNKHYRPTKWQFWLFCNNYDPNTPYAFEYCKKKYLKKYGREAE